VLLLQSLFNAGVFLVSVTGVIAIINIMLISVFKRTREIGTLCAIGASDFYIRSLILSENLIIGFFAGLFGLFAGFIILSTANSMQISINNDLLAGLLGGRILSVKILPQIALVSFCLAEFVSVMASVYPIETAVKIEPITALRQG
jgi:ABC-type antimicrobial peptide transport system permease subunit